MLSHCRRAARAVTALALARRRELWLPHSISAGGPRSLSTTETELAALAHRVGRWSTASAGAQGVDAAWAELAAAVAQYRALPAAAAGAEQAVRNRLFGGPFLLFSDALWREARVLYGEGALTAAEHWEAPVPAPTPDIARRRRVLHATAAAWYGSALALGVPLPQSTHAALVRLAGLRSLSAAKLACNAVALFGVAPGADALSAVLAACIRHGRPGHAWPYLVAMSVRGLEPSEPLLEALVACAQAESGAHPELLLARRLAEDARTAATAAEGEAGGGEQQQQQQGGSAEDEAAHSVLQAAGLGAARDAGTASVLGHGLGLNAERLRGDIAELRAVRAVFGAEGPAGDGGEAADEAVGASSSSSRSDALRAADGSRDGESAAAAGGSNRGRRGASVAGAAAATAAATGAPPRRHHRSRDEMLVAAVSAVNAAYGMPIEPPLPGTPEEAALAAAIEEAGAREGLGTISVAPLHSPDVAIALLLGDLKRAAAQDSAAFDSAVALGDRFDGDGDDAEEGDEGDEDDTLDPEQEAADSEAYDRLTAEAQVVRAALFGGAAPTQQRAALAHAAVAAVSAAASPHPPPAVAAAGPSPWHPELIMETAGTPPAPAHPAPSVVAGTSPPAPLPPPTVLLPEWVLQTLAAETARRDLAAAVLLPRMREAALGQQPPQHPPVLLSRGAAGALEERLLFAGRHSVLHLMPDSPPVAEAVLRWRVAMLALGRQAAAAAAAATAAAAAAVEPASPPAPAALGPRLVRIPYMSLLTAPHADPRAPDALLRPPAGPARVTGASGEALFVQLHPLHQPQRAAVAPPHDGDGAPPDPAASVRSEVALCLARVYESLMLEQDLEQEQDRE